MPKGLRKLDFSFEDSTLTHYGGMYLFQQFCRKLKLKRLFQNYVHWKRRESSFHSAELVLSILYAMIAGLKRISDTRILTYNGSFQKLLGLTQFPAVTTLRDFLKTLSPQELKEIVQVHDLLRKKFQTIPQARTSFIFDLDSTVLPLFGWKIQGSRVGYNPQYPRRPSYHSLICFEGHTQDTWHGMLRPGDTHPLSAARRFWRA